MSTSLALRSFLAVLVAVCAAVLPQRGQAHGSMVVPESRIYHCFLNNPENPSDPACRALKDAGGTQAFYDWTGVNQANANGNHQAVVPDGKLCSGNNPTFRGLDLARSDWYATPVANGADGTFEFVFRATAPHASRDWIFYVTRAGWSPDQPLRWSDLFEFCRFGSVPLDNGHYRFRCALPALSGKHTIYTVWQRSDSTEAFYTCTDVEFGGTTNPTWTDEGALTAQNALPAGTVVTLRLFNAAGNDVESVPFTVAAGQGAASEWPYRFALAVNAQAVNARIGVLGAGATITPQQSASANRVYTLTSQNLSHQVDIRLPSTNQPPVAAISASGTTVTGAGSVNLSGAGSSDPEGQALSYQWSLVSGSNASLSAASGVQTTLNLTAPAQDQSVVVRLSVSDGAASHSTTVSITHKKTGGGGDYDYAYPAGIGSYVAGQTVVLGSDSNRYRCRPFPEGGWCNVNSAFHYAPGTGTNWQDAWTRL